jgi:restriction endonuclease-like protein
MTYSELMKTHLGSYKTTHFGIKESGKWRNREYVHILPLAKMMLNIMEPIRHDFARYQASHPNLKLHRDFAHLNSSQAACINLFLPLLSGKLTEKNQDQSPLPFDASNINTYEFEYIPDGVEGTNFDFWIRTKSSKEIFCEFKLTESEFGRAKDDERHRQKLENIYLPMLAGKVSPDLLTPAWFFARYQLLRNIAYADPGGSASVLFVVPKDNEQLIRPLAEMREWLAPAIRPFVSVLYIEEIVSQLRATLDSDVAAYYDAYAAKYIPPGCADYGD